MCGIIGAIEYSLNSKLNFEKNGSLYKYISARGPDNYNHIVENIGDLKISLGHSRLAIIDLTDASNQPFYSEDSRYCLVFNGEIYNYLEIRKELTHLGLTFKTNGDTEVLLKSWEKWGPKCLHKLNGMFAFALLDKFAKELFLIRDRFGVKPLAYGRLNNGGILFSSSLASVAQEISSEVDLKYCSVGFRYGFWEGNENRTPFEKVKYIKPGTYIRYELGVKELISEEIIWYSLEKAVADKEIELYSKTHDELLEIGFELLSDATRLRLRSDVPLAISLSGGVDSTSIAVLANKEVANLVGFTYGDPKSPSSEGPAVCDFALKAGINVNYIWPSYSSNQLGDILERTMASQEAPLLGLSIIAQQEVYKEVKNHGFKVLLGGQGGDEAFAGYRKFFLVALRSALKRKCVKESFSLLYSLNILLLRGIGDYKHYWGQRSRYMASSGNEFNLLGNMPPIFINLLGETNNSLIDRQIQDIQFYSLPTLLRYEDRNSMSFGIESRLPFLDYRIIEYALALPVTLKINKGYGKWALRSIMTDLVPSSILNVYTKRGFDVTQNWVINGIGERLIDLVMAKKSNISNYLTLNADIDKILSVENLNKKSNLLAEALLLAFISDPIKPPIEINN